MSTTAHESWVAAAASGPPEFTDRPRDVGGPFTEFDLLGRKQPRRLGIPDYLLLVARIEPARVRRVPVAAIAEEGADEEGAEYAFIDCPCSHHPVARALLRRCAECERYYVLVGPGVVYVTYGAMAPPPLPTRT